MTDAVHGQHLLVDLFDAQRLDDVGHVERAMRDAVEAIGATLLALDLHHFGGEGGVTGVATLAESHLSIHTWPERGFAAIDVFVCGELKPTPALNVFRRAFEPGEIHARTVARGQLEAPAELHDDA